MLQRHAAGTDACLVIVLCWTCFTNRVTFHHATGSSHKLRLVSAMPTMSQGPLVGASSVPCTSKTTHVWSFRLSPVINLFREWPTSSLSCVSPAQHSSMMVSGQLSGKSHTQKEIASHSGIARVCAVSEVGWRWGRQIDLSQEFGFIQKGK